MKKTFAIIALSLASVFSANIALAQSRASQDVKTVSIRPYVGITGTAVINAETDLTYNRGLAVGVDAQYMYNKWFGLSTGVEYLNCGWEYDNNDWQGSTATLHLLGVPVLANFYPCKGLDFKVGLAPTFVLNSEVTKDCSGSGHSFKGHDALTGYDNRLVLGVSYEFKHFVLELRENLGTSDLFKHDDHKTAATMGNAILSLGYRF